MITMIVTNVILFGLLVYGFLIVHHYKRCEERLKNSTTKVRKA